MLHNDIICEKPYENLSLLDLICAVRLVDDIGVINGAGLDGVDQVENWEGGLYRLLVLEVLDRVRLATLFLLVRKFA